MMLRVVKIGGSLLASDDFVERVHIWFDRQPPAQNLVIVGGGELIDAVRQLDQLRPGDPVQIHWCCVSLLRATFELMSGWCPDWPVIDTSEAFDAAQSARFAERPIWLIAVDTFYRPESDATLSEDWRTTTDAIAAWFAIQTQADELVLLKSCDVERGLSLTELSERGVVDEAILGLEDAAPPIKVIQLPTMFNRDPA